MIKNEEEKLEEMTVSHHEQLGASDRLDLRSSSALIAICKEDKQKNNE